MIKVLANDGIKDSGKELLEKNGFEVDTRFRDKDELLQDISSFDALLVRSATKVTPEVMDAAGRLKFIGRGGVGLDNIDLAYAEKKGIKVFNTPGASSQSVAELVMAHMYTGARFLQDANRRMPREGHDQFKELKKQYSKGRELSGKTLGIVGFGRIGQAVGRLALGAGMKIKPYDMLFKETMHFELSQIDCNGQAPMVSLRPNSLEDVLRESDIITFHIPFASGSSYFISNPEFEKMKDGVMIINAARGGVIDEQALLDQLNSGKVSFAGLDVFENEPRPREDLLQHPRVSLTPHIGASTTEGQDRVWVEMAHHLINFFK